MTHERNGAEPRVTRRPAMPGGDYRHEQLATQIRNLRTVAILAALGGIAMPLLTALLLYSSAPHSGIGFAVVALGNISIGTVTWWRWSRFVMTAGPVEARLGSHAAIVGRGLLVAIAWTSVVSAVSVVLTVVP